MGCQKSLDFATAGGAHLSFYWTMDESGTADKLDSTVGLAWPLIHGAAAGVGLFSNGTDCDTPIFINQHRGVGVFGSTDITINQAVSKGISAWFWVKPVLYGAVGISGIFNLDTSDGAHTNRFRVLIGITDATTGSLEVDHTNDTDDVFVDTPNLTWTLGSWHMIAITYDKVAQTLNIYVDGTLSATTADAFTYPDLTNSDMELSNTSAVGNGDDFIADEFGICLNGALTATQVTALYNGGAGMTWPTVGTVVPYP